MNEARATRTWWGALLVVALVGCGGGGDGGGPAPAAPLASAGADASVQGGLQVTLSGATSRDPDGGSLTYAWEQTAGTSVALSTPTRVTTRFVAPVANADEVLAFRLTVTDNEGVRRSDSVRVAVQSRGVAMLSAQAIAPDDFTVAGGLAFFTARSRTNGQYQNQLWVTDGTSAGTRMLRQMAGARGRLNQLRPMGDGVMFAGNDGPVTDGLWFSDGTAEGTRLVKDLDTTTFERPEMAGTGGDYMYFTAALNLPSWARWILASDGTAAGTGIVQVGPGADARIHRPQTAVFWRGRFHFFAAWSGPGGGDSGSGVFAANGPGDNATVNPGSLFTDTTNDSNDMVVYQDRLFYSWDRGPDYEEGAELWVRDGSGQNVLLDLVPGRAGSYPTNLSIVNGTLLFWAYEPPGGGRRRALWTTDGTLAGTRVIARVDAEVDSDIVVIGGKAYFRGSEEGNRRYGLWVTDGTAAGTRLVSGAVEPAKAGMVAMGDRLLFHGNYEPWISDGTEAGTALIKELNPFGAAFPEDRGAGKFVVYRGKAYFMSITNSSEFHLMESDGTAAGTVPVRPPYATEQPGRGQLDDLPPVVVGDTLVFRGGFTSVGPRPYRLR